MVGGIMTTIGIAAAISARVQTLQSAAAAIAAIDVGEHTIGDLSYEMKGSI